MIKQLVNTALLSVGFMSLISCGNAPEKTEENKLATKKKQKQWNKKTKMYMN